MGRELIDRRHRAIPPVLLASKYGESASSLVTFLFLTCLNVVFLVAQTQQEKQVLIISNFRTKQLRHGKKLLAEKISSQRSTALCAQFISKRSDFELDYKAQFLGMKSCRCLKEGAISSLFLRGNSATASPTTTQSSEYICVCFRQLPMEFPHLSQHQ